MRQELKRGTDCEGKLRKGEENKKKIRRKTILFGLRLQQIHLVTNQYKEVVYMRYQNINHQLKLLILLQTLQNHSQQYMDD